MVKKIKVTNVFLSKVGKRNCEKHKRFDSTLLPKEDRFCYHNLSGSTVHGTDSQQSSS